MDQRKELVLSLLPLYGGDNTDGLIEAAKKLEAFILGD